MNKKAVLIIGILLLLILSLTVKTIGYSANIDSELEKRIEAQGSADVIITLSDASNEKAAPLIIEKTLFSRIIAFLFPKSKPELPLPKIPKTAKELLNEKKSKIREAQDSIIGQFKDGISPLSYDEKPKFSLKRRYETLNMLLVEVDSEALEILRGNPGIESIQEDKILHIALNESVPKIKAPNLHRMQIGGTNLTGAGETVAIIDTGIDSDHEAFTGKILGGYDFVNNDADPEDDHGHGTHVAGIAVGNGSQFKGVAPDANVVALKVCDASGSCSWSNVIAGIDWAVSNSEAYNISTISLSLGDGGEYTSTTCPDYSGGKDAVNTARSLGIMVTIASGNNGYDYGISYPACIENATSVGAVFKNDQFVAGTNAGEPLDLLAPGFSIYSAWFNGSYTSKTGTSMAAPHVAGLNLLFQQEARLRGISRTVDEIENAFKTSTVIFAGGYPRVDAISALNYIAYSLKINSTENSIFNSYGKIKFYSDPIFGYAGECLNVSYNNAYINSSAFCSNYNLSGRITLSGLPWLHFSVLKNGIPCPEEECSLTESGNTAVFTIEEAGNYSLALSNSLSLSDSADSQIKQKNQQVTFYANLTDAFGNPVNSGVCVIEFNLSGSWQDSSLVEYNSSSQLYEYNRTFNSEGSYEFNVSCDSLSKTSNFTITNPLSIIKVSISSPSGRNTTDEDLSCLANATNINGINMTYEGFWYKDGILNFSFDTTPANYTPGLLVAASILSESMTSEEENWTCSARAFDGNSYSNYLNSSKAKITSSDYISLTACRTISEAGLYRLQNNASGVFCFTINASNIEIDCRGYTINYGVTPGVAGKGIIMNSQLSNITIKNCNLNKFNTAQSGNIAISMNKTSNSTIANNTIDADGVANNFGIYLENSSSNIISGNSISTNGSSTNSHGIYLSNSQNNIFANNAVNTSRPTSQEAISDSNSKNNTWANLTLLKNGAEISFISEGGTAVKALLPSEAPSAPSGSVSLNKFINLTSSFPLFTNISYTASEISSSNAEESSLRIWKFNESAGNWTDAGFASSSGLNTADNYAYSNITSFSTFALFGSQDTTAPAVSVVFPANTTYSSQQTELNYTISESSPGSCWYSLNSGETNITITCGNNISSITSVSGANTWGIYANDSSGNSNFSSVIFEVSIPSPPSEGGGGGGSSPQSGSISASTPAVSAAELERELSRELGKNESVQFRIKGITHTLSIENVKADSATIIISSSPINITLKVGEEKTIDINSDSESDLIVRLNSIQSGKAEVSLKRIAPAPLEERAAENKTENKTEETTEARADSAGMKIIQIALIAALIIAAIIALIPIIRKKIRNRKLGISFG